MDTDKLILSLTKDLKPVRRVPAPLAGAVLLSVVAAGLVFFALLGLGGPRADWLEMSRHMPFMADSVIMFAAGALAAFAACRLAVPDTRVRGTVVGALFLATSAWVYLCGRAFLGVTAGGMQAALLSFADSAECILGLAVLIAAPLILAFFVMTRAAPVWRGWAGYAAVLSVSSFGALGMRFLCQNENTPHLLLGHFLPVILFFVSGIFLGKTILRRGL